MKKLIDRKTETRLARALLVLVGVFLISTATRVQFQESDLLAEEPVPAPDPFVWREVSRVPNPAYPIDALVISATPPDPWNSLTKLVLIVERGRSLEDVNPFEPDDVDNFEDWMFEHSVFGAQDMPKPTVSVTWKADDSLKVTGSAHRVIKQVPSAEFTIDEKRYRLHFLHEITLRKAPQPGTPTPTR